MEMLNAYEPHNWLGLFGLVVIAAGAIIPAWISHRRLKTQSAAVLGQVKNNHSTNLRDDLDRIHDDVREVLVMVVKLETRFEEHIDICGL